jgi:hypothetical protein
VTGVFAYLVLVVVVPALLLGHQGQDFPPLRWWRALRSRMPRRGAWRGRGAPHSPSGVSRDLEPAPEPPQSRTEPRVPTWAQPDKEAEAA